MGLFASPSFASTFISGTSFQFQNPYFLFMLQRSMLFIAFCLFLLIWMQMVFLNLMLLLAGIFFRLRKVAFFNYLFAQFWSNFVLGSLDCDHNNAFFCDVRDSSFYSFVICPILFELTIMLEVSRFIFSFLSSGTQRSSPFGRVSKGNFIITSTS
jgi:hypothetical protein